MSDALSALARIGGHVRVHEVAHVMATNTRKAHDELTELIDQGLVVGTTYYHPTPEGIEKLRAAGLVCTRCRGFLHGEGKPRLCVNCAEHDRHRAKFARRRQSPTTHALHRASVRDREKRVLELRRQGVDNRAIASRLGINYTAVKNALQRLRERGVDVGDQRRKART